MNGEMCWNIFEENLKKQDEGYNNGIGGFRCHLVKLECSFFPEIQTQVPEFPRIPLLEGQTSKCDIVGVMMLIKLDFTISSGSLGEHNQGLAQSNMLSIPENWCMVLFVTE